MINKKLLMLLGKDKYRIALITILKLISFVFYISSTAIICYVLKEIIINHSVSSLYFLLLIVLFVILKICIDRYNGYLQVKISEEVEKKLRCDLFDKITNHPGDFQGYNAQALSQLSTEGIEQLNLYYTSYLPQFFYSLIAPILLFIAFMFICIPSAIVFLVCVPLIPMSIIMVSKYAKKIFAIYWDRYLSMGGDFLDNIKGMKELKIFLYDLKRQRTMDENAEEFRKITMKVLIMQLWSTSIMDFVSYAGAAVGMVVALVSLSNGGILNPFLAVFIVFVGIEFFMPMRTLGSLFHVSMNGATAGEKIIHILNTKTFVDGSKEITNLTKIEFRNASLAYAEEVVLNDFNLLINKPGFYSIVGNSGSGKSTILKALNRSLQVNNEMLWFNDVDCNEIKHSSLLSEMTFLSYESHVFKKSIRDNFLIVNPKVTDKEMKDALKAVFLDKFDLDYVFTDDATNVSGGEKQRFILAFYLTLKKKIIVLDEVTSNIDKESEDIIVGKIKGLRKDNIILMVSHRLENVKDSDFIYFINDHQLEAKGTYTDLMENQAFCALVNEQKGLEGVQNEKI